MSINDFQFVWNSMVRGVGREEEKRRREEGHRNSMGLERKRVERALEQ